MAFRFDEDPVGAVLEFAFLLTEPSKATERKEWVEANLGDSDPQIWETSAFTKAHLIPWLSRTRNSSLTRQRIHRAVMLAERNGLLESRWQDDDPVSPNRSITPLAAMALAKNTLRECVLGLPFVAQRWRHSIFKIYKRDGEGIGTGFLVRPDTLATARHVIDDLGDYVVSSESWPEHKFVDAGAPDDDDGSRIVAIDHVTMHPDERVDLALLHLEKPAHWVMPLRIAQTWQLLDEVVILGYPPVPQAQDSYLIAARGEINADVTTYVDRQRYLIISCLPRGGFSGGPVLNRHGEVIGLITRSLVKETWNEGSLNSPSESRADGVLEKPRGSGLLQDAAVGFLAALPSQYLISLLGNEEMAVDHQPFDDELEIPGT